MPAASPARLKLLNGRAPGKDSAGRPVNLGPNFVRSSPSPPSWLGREAKAEWRRIVPELDRLRLLSRVTRASLTAYVETWQTFVDATRLVRSEGLTIDAKQGTLSHPAVGIQRAAGAELRKWATEYGMTPASEQRIKVPEADNGSEDFD